MLCKKLQKNWIPEYHGEDNSVREISQMLGWSEAKVKIRAFRARHAMRKALSRLNLSEKRKAGENLDQQI